jgi:hypothetical protein
VRRRPWAARALATIELSLSERVSVRAGAGVGLDVVNVDPRSSAPDQVVLDKPRSLAVAVGSAGGAIDVRLSRRLSLSAAVVAELDPSGTRYVFLRGDAEHVVLRPWPVRPACLLGVTFH